MFSRKIFRTVLLPAAALVAETSCKKVTKARPSDLPIYQPEPAPLAKEPETTIPAVPGFIEDSFATARIQLTKIYQEAKAYQRVGVDYLEQSKGNAEWLLKYLRQEDDATPKAGAIAIGALTGFIFGLRGGLFKRTIYATTGALGMASVCYPKEAAEYSQIGITEARKYATIAYNFAYGVEEQPETVQVNAVSRSGEQGDETGAAENVVGELYKDAYEKCLCPQDENMGHDQ